VEFRYVRPLRITPKDTGDGAPVRLSPSPQPFPSLAQAIATCREEVLVVQSKRQDVLREVAGTRARAGGEVRMRVLYHDTMRSDERIRRDATAVGRLGAEVRTTRELFGDLIILDRNSAFLREGDGGQWLVRSGDSPILKLLCSLFDRFWTSATSIHEPEPDGTEDSKRAILRMLAQGEKDEAIARRLGISVRTCRRRIAEFLEEVGAESRFQAGYLAARKREPPTRS
jgi:hypothetical protein